MLIEVNQICFNSNANQKTSAILKIQQPFPNSNVQFTCLQFKKPLSILILFAQCMMTMSWLSEKSIAQEEEKKYSEPGYGSKERE